MCVRILISIKNLKLQAVILAAEAGRRQRLQAGLPRFYTKLKIVRRQKSAKIWVCCCLYGCAAAAIYTFILILARANEIQAFDQVT